MTDDIEVRRGGALCVDTTALMMIAAALRAVALRIDDAVSAVQAAYRAVDDAPGLRRHVDAVSLWAGADRLQQLHAELTTVASGTALMAAAYELVELRAERAARGAQGRPADALDARIRRLAGSDPRLPGMAESLVADWRNRRFQGLSPAVQLGGPIASLGLDPIAYATAMLGAHGRWGVVPAGTTLRGAADPVAVRPVITSEPIGPPDGLAAGLRRLPTEQGAQLAVERYTMPDGSRRFVLYAKGTQSVAVGGSEPWDMKSNRELYFGERSASYQATVDALHQSGARPGDTVMVFAHSQAGMIAAHLAMESEFDVALQVTAGSPVEPTLRDDQVLIQLRHTDDVVAALAGGGAVAGTGSPESFTVQRVGDPHPGVQDLWLEAHHLDTYLTTAELTDRSADVRTEGITAALTELGGAVQVVSTVYRAERVG